jgi:hypothetical protein
VRVMRPAPGAGVPVRVVVKVTLGHIGTLTKAGIVPVSAVAVTM